MLENPLQTGFSTVCDAALELLLCVCFSSTEKGIELNPFLHHKSNLLALMVVQRDDKQLTMEHFNFSFAFLEGCNHHCVTTLWAEDA